MHACKQQQQMQAPVMIIIGEVVSLANELDWFQAEIESNYYEKNAALR